LSAATCSCSRTPTFYALPEGNRGIFVGGGGSHPRLIGASRMPNMMLTGRVYSADEGQQFGLSNYLADVGEVCEKHRNRTIKEDLQRPRNLTVAVECSATQGHGKTAQLHFRMHLPLDQMRAIAVVARDP